MKQKFRFFGRIRCQAYAGAVLALLGLLTFVVCLSACRMGNNPNGTNSNGANSNGTDLFVPDEAQLPPAAERELISEADVLGAYHGNTIVTMDGTHYGPYLENIKIGRKPSGDLFFISPKVVYKSMQLDIGYDFEKKDAVSPNTEFILTPAADGKSFVCTGKKGTLSFYGKGSDTLTIPPVPSNTSVNGVIYKKGGMVYISFTTVYDTQTIRDTFHLKPNMHRSMSSSMKNGIKK